MKRTKSMARMVFWGLLPVLVLTLAAATPSLAQGGTWITVAPMLNSRFGPAGGVIDGKFYVVSGSSPQGGATNTVEAYDPLTNTWTPKAPIPTNRANAGAGVIDGKLYVVGGCIGSNCGSGNTNILEVYDPTSDAWTLLAAMPTARNHVAVGVIDGKLYVAGGMQQCGPCIPLNTLEVYDPATDTWDLKAPMPTSRSQAGGAIINGQFYVVGGHDGPPSYTFDTVEVYNPATNTWTTKAPMPTLREDFSNGVVNGILYTVSGNSFGHVVDTVEAYDPGSNTWTSCTPIPTPRTAAVAGVINGVLYVAGSQPYNPGPWSTKVEAFTPQQANHPPTANAGGNREITSEMVSATVIQGTASDPDQDSLQYRWLEGTTVLLDWRAVGANGEANLNLNSVSLARGTHALTLEVSDGKVTVADQMVLTIDNSAPHAAPSGGGAYEVNTPITLGGQVSDYDGDTLSYQWLEGSVVLGDGTATAIPGGTPVDLVPQIITGLKLGDHTITLRVSDGVSQPVEVPIMVQIVDKTAPTLAPVADQTILWPPNKKMVPVTITANASDNSGLPVTLTATVSCNEPNEGAPYWTQPVIDQARGIITVQLQADRLGKGKGRQYTISINATDKSGNMSTATVVVSVPHDQGKN